MNEWPRRPRSLATKTPIDGARTEKYKCAAPLPPEARNCPLIFNTMKSLLFTVASGVC